MAGRQHNAADRLLRTNRKRNGGRRRRGRPQYHLKPVPGENLGNPLCKLIRQKPPVTTNHHPLAGSPWAMFFPAVRRGLRDSLDVGECEILGNDCTPSVGPKLDRRTTHF